MRHESAELLRRPNLEDIMLHGNPLCDMCHDKNLYKR
jgi:hypothetical protein